MDIVSTHRKVAWPIMAIEHDCGRLLTSRPIVQRTKGQVRGAKSQFVSDVTSRHVTHVPEHCKYLHSKALHKALTKAKRTCGLATTSSNFLLEARGLCNEQVISRLSFLLTILFRVFTSLFVCVYVPISSPEYLPHVQRIFTHAKIMCVGGTALSRAQIMQGIHPTPPHFASSRQPPTSQPRIEHHQVPLSHPTFTTRMGMKKRLDGSAVAPVPEPWVSLII